MINVLGGKYWTVNTEDRVILMPLPPILGGIFGGIFWWYILERPKAEPKYTTKIYHQKYHPISGNIARGVAECDISRYQTRKSSRVKYPTHPEGPTSRGTREAAPRDVWDISRGMISEFDIAR